MCVACAKGSDGAAGIDCDVEKSRAMIMHRCHGLDS